MIILKRESTYSCNIFGISWFNVGWLFVVRWDFHSCFLVLYHWILNGILPLCSRQNMRFCNMRTQIMNCVKQTLSSVVNINVQYKRRVVANEPFYTTVESNEVIDFVSIYMIQWCNNYNGEELANCKRSSQWFFFVLRVKNSFSYPEIDGPFE